MPTTIFKNERNRLAFNFSRAHALRSANDVIDQLQAQIEQLQFNAAEDQQQLSVLSRELAGARLELVKLGEVHLELARRDLRDALASADSPSAVH